MDAQPEGDLSQLRRISNLQIIVKCWTSAEPDLHKKPTSFARVPKLLLGQMYLVCWQNQRLYRENPQLIGKWPRVTSTRSTVIWWHGPPPELRACSQTSAIQETGMISSDKLWKIFSYRDNNVKTRSAELEITWEDLNVDQLWQETAIRIMKELLASVSCHCCGNPLVRDPQVDVAVQHAAWSWLILIFTIHYYHPVTFVNSKLSPGWWNDHGYILNQFHWSIVDDGMIIF